MALSNQAELGTLHPTQTVSPHQRRLLRQRARKMRHAATETEWLLWSVLRSKQQGAVFRRQVVLQGYIVDFYACAAKLIVEVDGSFHASRLATDARRDRILSHAGYCILRVTAQQVLEHLPQVIARIRAAL